MNKGIACILAVSFLSFGISQSQASVVLNALEVGGNVQISGSGTLNLSGLSSVGIAGATDYLWATEGAVSIGTPGFVDVYTGAISGPSSFGVGAGSYALAEGTGTIFGIDKGAPNWLFVEQGYVSNALLIASAFFSGTFADLGLTLGTYVWSWGEGETADSFTLNVGVAAIPLPAGLPLLAAGLGAIGLLGWRKKRSANTAVVPAA